jgi:DNA invertase Pin-like site-specific DNA recombinase
MPTAHNIALCYIRLSLTKTQDDENSPERQKANCAEYCAFRGWTPEFFEDRDGHKSGTKESNRPGWLALKERAKDPDVVAIVGNDLSRFHRKGFRMGQLMEMCKEQGLELVKAADKKSIDVNDITATMWVMMEGLFNEFYAEDISRKQKDSVRFRMSNGIVVGRVPFGTIRPRRNGKSGHLERSPYGVWLLPDGEIVEGVESERPAEGAVWRGYFAAAVQALRLYALNLYGGRKIADMLNREGYRFRDIDGEPRLFDRQCIRSIVANWPEYGGVVLGKKATDRNAKKVSPDTVTLNQERAVVDIDLCIQVGFVRSDRYRDHQQHKPGSGDRADSFIFPLSGITYCAHCDTNAQDKDDPSLRTHFIGHEGARIPRYRHSERRHKCAARNRSVKAEILEREFARLVSALMVKPEMVGTLTEMLKQINGENLTEDRRTEILSEIALCKQRITNAEKLFLMARIDEATLKHHLEENDRQIAALQAQLSEENQVRQMVELTANMLADMGNRWQESSNEDKQQFAQTLFSEVVFDLDTHQITGFALKPWADQFLQIRAAHDGAAMYLEGFEPPASCSVGKRSIR